MKELASRAGTPKTKGKGNERETLLLTAKIISKKKKRMKIINTDRCMGRVRKTETSLEETKLSLACEQAVMWSGAKKKRAKRSLREENGGVACSLCSDAAHPCHQILVS